MSYKLVLCDDEIHILRAAEFKLSKAGYDVRCARDGQEGWDLVQNDPPDLVVTDLQMPCMDGFALCSRIRADENLADIPVVMLTAKGYEISGEEVKAQYGVNHLLTKPFSPRELLQLIDKLLQPEASEKATSAVAAESEG